MRHRMQAVIVLVLLLALAGCAGVTAPPSAPAAEQAPATEQAPAENTPDPELDCTVVAAAKRPSAPPLREAYAVDSIVLVGLPSDVLTVIAAANDASVRFEFPLNLENWQARLSDPPGDSISEPLPYFVMPLPGTPEEQRQTAAVLFGVAPIGDDVTEPLNLLFAAPTFTLLDKLGSEASLTDPLIAAAHLVTISDELYAQGQISFPVLAQLNMRTALPASIDPNGVGAHDCGPLVEAGGVSHDLFWGQWALASAGINVEPFGVDRGCGSIDGSTEPIQVTIFDTIPLTPTGGEQSGTPFGALQVDLGDRCNGIPLSVAVSSLVNPMLPSSPLSQHGIFASGLTYATWRHATLDLVGVLDSDGQGDLFTLLKAMALRRNALLSEGRPAVFNLSLGIDPVYAEMSQVEYDTLVALLESGSLEKRASMQFPQLPRDGDGVIPPLTLLVNDDPKELPGPLANTAFAALETTLRLVGDAGIVVVAAAGNAEQDPNGAPSGNSTAARSPQYPAAYADVLGVAALQGGGGIANYSFDGDIAAPGGGGETEVCSDATCAEGVVSVVADAGLPSGFRLGFWSGTSFATPLVSGLVAQRYANYVQNHPANPVAPGSVISTFIQELVSNCQASTSNSSGSAAICIADEESSPPMQ